MMEQQKKFKNNQFDYDNYLTIINEFEKQVERFPDKIAIIHNDTRITYRELNILANKVGNILISSGVDNGDKVAIDIRRGISYIAAILGILKIGAIYVPLDFDFPQSRKEYILNDCQSKIIITESDIEYKNYKKVNWNQIIEGSSSKDLVTDHYVKESLDEIVYIMYTSGTTGFPKGVQVGGRGIIRLIKDNKSLTMKNTEVMLHGSSLAFDASTLEIYAALLNGACLSIIDKEDLIDSQTLKEKLKNDHVNRAFFTTPLFNSLCEQDPSVFNELEQVIIGGDRASNKHLKIVMKNSKKTQFYNGYGPTENTVFTTMHNIQYSELEGDIPIGKAINDTGILIVNENFEEVKKGEVGELVVTGGGLAIGYLNQKDASQGSFISLPNLGIKRAYKTGDYVRENNDGDLIFIGRRDSQIKYRGFRIELREIESIAKKIDHIREAICLLIGEKSNSKLVLFAESNSSVSEASIIETLHVELPEYMVPNDLILLDNMPLKLNGKVDSDKLKQIYLEKIQSQVEKPSESNTERFFIEILEDVLKKPNLNLEMNFFEIGGHSLNATIISTRLSEAFHKKISVRDVMLNPNLKDLFHLTKVTEDDAGSNLEVLSKADNYDCSPTQSRLFLLNKSRSDTSYNIPYFIKVSSNIDMEQLKKAIWKELKENEILRTIYTFNNSKIVQKVLPFEKKLLNISVEYEPIIDFEYLQKYLIQPFDLEKSIPFRASIIKSNSDIILFLDIHHIAIDGFSLNQLLKNIEKNYFEIKFTRPKFTYKDYSNWINKQISNGKYMQKKQYWQEQLKGYQENIFLGIEKTIKPNSKRTIYYNREISSQLYEQLRDYIVTNNISLNILFMTALYILIAKYSSINDIVIGSPVSGKVLADLEEMIGSFINSLPIRYKVDPSKTILETIEDVKKQVMDALENQEYPIDSIVSDKNKENTEIASLFDIMFVMQTNFKQGEQEKSNQIFLDYQEIPIDSKMNLIVEGIDFGNTVKFQITYPVELYDDDSIIQLMDSFLQVIESIIQNDRRCVKEIEIISQDQKDFIDLNYNKTAKDFKFDNQCLKQLIERNVAKMPNKIAIACDEENISFEQLNMRSNFMANKLKDLGLQVGDVVGVMKDRNIEAIIIILALIKLGVTYVPLDSGTPIERVKKIFVKSGMKFVITDLVPLQKDILIIDTNAPDFQGLSKQNPKTEINLDQMLYIIFTSGSTGEPKGVAISNKQCINTILDINHKFTLSPKDNILLISSFAFDLSVYDIFGALVSGATLTIASQNKDTNYLKKVVQNNPITVWNSVPAYMELICNVLADQKPILSIRNIILSGDWIPLELPLKIKKIFPNANLFSAGGATEGSIWSIYYPIVKVEPEWKSIPYGMPLANQQMYILNNMGNELPIGVMGNIYIGGVGVAMGYINDIEKTNDSFINHPKLGRIYKTGDLGRLTSQGYMEFCGRKDIQVKVNGNRIELGEIQAILQSFETIQNAIVTVGQNDYQKQLLAYYKSDNEIEKDVLNQFMKQYLPNYMIPSHYIYMSEFPLTSNGKIDKKQLPDPKKIESIKEVKDVKPKNQLEETVLTIWENVLEHQVLSVTDSFFSEGGNSLMATVIIGQIKDQCNVDLSLEEFYENDSIEALGNLIIDKLLF